MSNGIITMRRGGALNPASHPWQVFGYWGQRALLACGFLLLFVLVVLAVAGCDEGRTTWTTESGLEITEITQGDGSLPKKGDLLHVNYTASYIGGKQFDSQMDPEAPYRFRFKVDEVLPGLEEGVATMRPGGKRILVLPPKLAFGESGLPGTVPENTWVRMEVELRKIEPSPPPPEPWSDAGYEIVALESGLQYVDFEVGTGESPVIGSTIVVHYSGYLDDGTLFDTTHFRMRPLQFEFTTDELIRGWIEGLLTMKEGGLRKLIIPPYMGYGEKGFRSVPPNATLIYDIELVAVLPPEK